MYIIHFLKYKRMKPIAMRSAKNSIIHIIITMIMMLSIPTKAQNTVTLSQAINNGLANRKNNSASKLDITISKLQTQALYRKFWPQVSAEYTYVYNPILQTSILPIGIFNPTYPIDATKSVQFGTKWTQSAGLNATQPLFDLSIQRHINEAKLQERIVVLSQDQSEYELAYTIAQTYIDIYLEKAKINSLIADTNRTYISYILLKNKYNEKRLLKSDLNKSRINHNNTVQLLADGVAQLIENKVYLLFLMGANEIEKWDFEIDPNFTIKYSLSNPVNQINLDQLPNLQQLLLQSQLTNLQARSERTKYLPILNFKGFLGANQFSNAFNPIASNSWFGLSYLGFEAKIPLLFGENPYNKTQQLKLQYNQYLLQKEDKIIQYTREALTAKLKMDNLKTQLATQIENITLSSESIAIFQDRVKEGQESSLNLNLEEASLQLLKANYEANKNQFWAYWLNYLKASGQLTILWK